MTQGRTRIGNRLFWINALRGHLLERVTDTGKNSQFLFSVKNYICYVYFTYLVRIHKKYNIWFSNTETTLYQLYHHFMYILPLAVLSITYLKHTKSFFRISPAYRTFLGLILRSFFHSQFVFFNFFVRSVSHFQVSVYCRLQCFHVCCNTIKMRFCVLSRTLEMRPHFCSLWPKMRYRVLSQEAILTAVLLLVGGNLSVRHNFN